MTSATLGTDGPLVRAVSGPGEARAWPETLQGEVALITGASSGLGRHFAAFLAGLGVRVAVAARRRAQLDDLVDEIRSRGGVAEAITLDVCCREQFGAALDAVEDAIGLPSFLINNAGTFAIGDLTELEVSDIDVVLQTNLIGPLLLSRELAKRWIRVQHPGRIVNVSSMSAYWYSDVARSAIYSITKAAVVRMTEVMAVDWAKHQINVNAIAPGTFHSEMTDKVPPEMLRAATGSMPRQRMGFAHQLESTLYYLLSPQSDFVTGVCIKVDDAQLPR